MSRFLDFLRSKKRTNATECTVIFFWVPVTSNEIPRTKDNIGDKENYMCFDIFLSRILLSLSGDDSQMQR